MKLIVINFKCFLCQATLLLHVVNLFHILMTNLSLIILDSFNLRLFSPVYLCFSSLKKASLFQCCFCSKHSWLTYCMFFLIYLTNKAKYILGHFFIDNSGHKIGSEFQLTPAQNFRNRNWNLLLHVEDIFFFTYHHT